MAVVINEFEVITEPAPRRAPAAPASPAASRPTEQPDPRDLAPLLQVLATQALRVWAH